MLDKDKIILMTRMASYEATEGKKMIPIAGYFRSDYVGFNIIKSAVSVTLAFIVIVSVYLVCNADKFISEFYEANFMDVVSRFINIYGFVLVIYILVSYIVYSFKYTAARKSVRIYQKALKKLISMYGR
ncbi:MAG: hypothetical protein K6G84_10840 [Lachnospiraceae bacterium]|nr:hypothetical protein [Lachnospiraceae bacterium]